MRIFRNLFLTATLFSALPLSMTAQAPAAATTAKTAVATKAAAATSKLDINTASADQLKAIPGIGDAYSKRIIDGRPYTAKNQLVSRGILPQGVYDKVKDQIVASKVKK